MSDEQATKTLQEFIAETGKTEFTATDLVEWQKRRERLGLRLVEREEKVSAIITVNEEGQAMMDVRFWMDYARKTNVMYNAIRQALEKIDELEPAGAEVNAIANVLRGALPK